VRDFSIVPNYVYTDHWTQNEALELALLLLLLLVVE
jgi:hypothetical protein